MNVERITLEEWAGELPSTGIEVFHLPEALRVINSHTEYERRLYAARKGEETIGLLPLFVRDRRVGQVVTSPPPGLAIPRLGPILLPNSPKRRKRERINQTLVGEVLDDLGIDDSTTLFRLVTPLEYEDPRPFFWHDLDLDPKFTYVVDVSEAEDFEDLAAGFSKSLRSSMRKLPEVDVTVTDERQSGAIRIHEDVRDRYLEQDETPPVDRRFVEDLTEALDDRYRAYVARDGSGEYLGGVLTLHTDDLAYYWLGGVRNTYQNVSVNSLVNSRVLRDLVSDPALESVTGYDLVGANTERLCEYKSKFSGRLSPYYTAETSGIGMATAKTAYRMFSGSLTKG